METKYHSIVPRSSTVTYPSFRVKMAVCMASSSSISSVYLKEKDIINKKRKEGRKKQKEKENQPHISDEKLLRNVEHTNASFFAISAS